MNIALEKTEEYINGEHKRSYGDAFIRGNNGEPRLLERFNAIVHFAVDIGAVMYISSDA